jgi:hypothetical protein
VSEEAVVALSEKRFKEATVEEVLSFFGAHGFWESWRDGDSIEMMKCVKCTCASNLNFAWGLGMNANVVIGEDIQGGDVETLGQMLENLNQLANTNTFGGWA